MSAPQNSNDYGFKVVIVGAKGVGKTCLFNRYCFNSFNINTQETIGINFHSTNLSLQTYDQNGLEEENYITNSIFDLAGHERFKPLIPKFIEGSSGALLVFDSVDPTSIKELDYWYNAIMDHAGDAKIPILLVASKSDLIEESNFKTVSEETIQQVIRKKRLNGFYRTSSLENYNVLEVFRELSELMLRHHKENLAVI